MSSTQQSQCEFQRLSRTVVLISAMYFLLTMPYAIIHFLASYYGTFRLKTYLKYRETFETLIYIFHTLSHCNSFINPFIYAGMRTVKRIFRRSSSVVAIEHKSAENTRKTLLQAWIYSFCYIQILITQRGSTLQIFLGRLSEDSQDS